MCTRDTVTHEYIKKKQIPKITVISFKAAKLHIHRLQKVHIFHMRPSFGPIQHACIFPSQTYRKQAKDSYLTTSF